MANFRELQNTESQSNENSDRRALPAPPTDTGIIQSLPVDTTVRLDDLGPVVINVDGSMSRIGNWENMAPIERENVMRVLIPRNRQRLAALQQRQLDQNSNESQLDNSNNTNNPSKLDSNTNTVNVFR